MRVPPRLAGSHSVMRASAVAAVGGAQQGGDGLQLLQELGDVELTRLAPRCVGAGYQQQNLHTLLADALAHGHPVGAWHLQLELKREGQQAVGGFVNLKVFGKAHFFARPAAPVSP